MGDFVESGMKFVFPDEQIFRIEKSRFYMDINDRRKSLSSVECLYFNKNVLSFIEAKSSFPKVSNVEDFNKNIHDVSDKFIHSFELYLSHFVGVNTMLPDETPARFLDYDLSSKKKIVFALIINCKNVEKCYLPDMISTIQNAFLKRFGGHKSIWGVDFITLDHETAMEKNLVEGLAE